MQVTQDLNYLAVKTTIKIDKFQQFTIIRALLPSEMATEHYWSASILLHIIIKTLLILVILCISETHLLGENVSLAWNSDPIPNLVGYRLYYGTAPNAYTQKIEVGNFTTVSVPNLIGGKTYFFAVTAYNTLGVESGPSNQVSYSVPSASSGTGLVGPFLPIPSDQTVLPGSTVLNDNDSHFVYSGGWALNHWPSYDYLGDEHFSAVAGSTATLNFTGTQVQLYSTLAYDLGYVEIILDNVPIGFVDAYASVRTPSKIIYTSPVLPAGPHSIAMKVTGQKNALSSYSYVVVDRANVLVGPSPNSTPAPNPILPIPSDQTVLPGSTVLNDNDSHFVYSGGWALNHWPSDYLGDEHYSAVAGSTATLNFTGTQVQLYSTLAHDLGYVEIILDNVPIGFIDAYASVRTPSKIIYTSPVLPAGSHSVAMKVSGQKNALSSHWYVVADRANVVVAAASMPSSAPMASTSVSAPSSQVSDTVAFPQPAAAVAQASASTAATPTATAAAATTTTAIAASAVPSSTPRPTRLLAPVKGTSNLSQLLHGGSVEAAAYAQWSARQ